MPSPAKVTFIESLALRLASYSKAVITALKQQIVELGRVSRILLTTLIRLIRKTITWLITNYYKLETNILAVVFDVWTLLWQLRVFVFLVLIGIGFLYWHLWMFCLYMLIILLSLWRHFESPGDDEELKKHQIQSRDAFVKWVRWPLRIIAALVVWVVFFPSGSWEKLLSEFPKVKKDIQSVSNSVNTGDDAKKSDSVAFTNNCDEEIQMMVHYCDLNKGWLTDGWYMLPKGKNVSLNIRSIGKKIYFYAKSSAGNSVWDGTADTEAYYGGLPGSADENEVAFFSIGSGSAYGSTLNMVCQNGKISTSLTQ